MASVCWVSAYRISPVHLPVTDTGSPPPRHQMYPLKKGLELPMLHYENEVEEGVVKVDSP